MGNTDTVRADTTQLKCVASSATATVLWEKLHIVSTSLQIIVKQLLTNIMLKPNSYL